MPDELFFNSKVGVVSCIMVFKAHRPHPDNKETFFGYFKDDGFAKRKIQGRFDAYGKWEKIKEKWLSYYLNRKKEAGFSVNKIVTAKDEWCAEAYMETDYSTLEKENFENTIFDYIAFLFSNKLLHANKLSVNAISDGIPLKYNNEYWKLFKICDLFDIKKRGRLTIYNRLHNEKNIPLLTASSENNGVVDYISYYDFETEKKIFEQKITIDMFWNVFYHDYEYFSDDNIHTLIPKFESNKFISMFIVTIIRKLKYKYSFGRQARIHRINRKIIKLPTKKGKPDFQYMENFIKPLAYSSSIGSRKGVSKLVKDGKKSLKIG